MTVVLSMINNLIFLDNDEKLSVSVLSSSSSSSLLSRIRSGWYPYLIIKLFVYFRKIIWMETCVQGNYTPNKNFSPCFKIFFSHYFQKDGSNSSRSNTSCLVFVIFLLSFFSLGRCFVRPGLSLPQACFIISFFSLVRCCLPWTLFASSMFSAVSL